MLLVVLWATGAGLLGAAAETASPVAARVVALWPDGSPNHPAAGARPILEIFPPFSAGHSLAATIVILPGGGYAGLSPYEALWAEYFRGLGYTAVVVHYRVAPQRHPAPFADAARAIRLLRHQAAEWRIPAHHLVLMGASAGGHLAALVATQPDLYRDPADDLAGVVSARPDRLILAYPVISAVADYASQPSFLRLLGPDASRELRASVSPELHVTAATPPTFLFHAADDAVSSVENSLGFARACWRNKVPAELHVFPRGGHGRLFAYDAEISPRWRELVRQWLANWKLD